MMMIAPPSLIPHIPTTIVITSNSPSHSTHDAINPSTPTSHSPNKVSVTVP